MVSLKTCQYFSFFFNDTATTEIYTLSLHDALPIYQVQRDVFGDRRQERRAATDDDRIAEDAQLVDEADLRSEEHTSELQSPCNLVCRLLLEKKKELWLRMSVSLCSQPDTLRTAVT